MVTIFADFIYYLGTLIYHTIDFQNWKRLSSLRSNCTSATVPLSLWGRGGDYKVNLALFAATTSAAAFSFLYSWCSGSNCKTNIFILVWGERSMPNHTNIFRAWFHTELLFYFKYILINCLFCYLRTHEKWSKWRGTKKNINLVLFHTHFCTVHQLLSI